MACAGVAAGTVPRLSAYPLAAHLRGVLAHLVFGLAVAAVAAVTETERASQGRRRPSRCCRSWHVEPLVDDQGHRRPGGKARRERT
jgi:hypothetical protein